MEAIAKGCGIKNTVTVRELKDFERAVDNALAGNELTFIFAKVAPGEELVTLPRQEGRENKYRFVRHIEKTEGIQVINPYARRRSKDFIPSN